MDNNQKALRMALVEMFARGYITIGRDAKEVGFDEKQTILEIEKEFIKNNSLGQFPLDYFYKTTKKDMNRIPDLTEQRRKLLEDLGLREREGAENRRTGSEAVRLSALAV
ncbi:hypothetical protein [Acetivibrio cellulolyticus]|uniref:hypothetical protein n=1 Tax=Acetivibrio cellulolyticus TaxID=35830 RepID=UPI0001E2D575|nr:hypothetical protein [Acetivibrio cellulolyticus]